MAEQTARTRLASVEAQILNRVSTGRAKQFDYDFVFGKIAYPKTPWLESEKLLNGILSHPMDFPITTIAEAMQAAVIRAHEGLQIGELDEKGTLAQWQSAPMDVSQLDIYRTRRPVELPALASLLLNGLIKSQRVSPEFLSDVGFGLLPHLFKFSNAPEMFPDLERLHERLLAGHVDKTEELAQYALEMGDSKFARSSGLNHKEQWLFHSRFTATKICLAGGQQERARGIVDDTVITNIRFKRLLNKMLLTNLIERAPADKMQAYVHEANNLIEETELGSDQVLADLIRMDLGLALLRNPGIATNAYDSAQAKSWFANLRALKSNIARQLIDLSFGSSDSYLDAIYKSTEAEKHLPESLSLLVFGSGSNELQVNLAQALIRDSLKFIQKGYMAPHEGVLKLIVENQKVDEAVGTMFTLAQTVLEEGLNAKVDLKIMSSEFAANFLAGMLEVPELQRLFGRGDMYMDNIKYIELFRLIRNAIYLLQSEELPLTGTS